MNNTPSGPGLSPIEGNREIQTRRHRFTLQRVYPALIFVPLFYALVRYLPPATFLALIIVVASLAFWEFTKVTAYRSPSSISLIAWMSCLVIILNTMQWTTPTLPIAFFTLLVVTLLLTFMVVPQRREQLLSHPLCLLFGTAYVGICLGHLLLIRKLESGDLLIFFVIAVTWAADTAGYYIGASMGKRPIAPRLSPKKTVEGFAAGLIFSMVLAVACHFWFLPSLPIADCLIIGILLACVGLLGDLAESAFKRTAGVKDSGTLIPGHGGVLDRIDSLLLTAPAFYYYILLANSISHA